MNEPSRNADQSQGSSSSLSERLVALVGAIAVVAVVGVMFWQALYGDDSPPNVKVELVRIVPNGDNHLVKILAINSGGNTAAGATIRGELIRDGRLIESSSVTIDYVPPHSEVQAGLYFNQEPTPQALKLFANGYHRP
ncbi:MAG: hypothetical protein UMU75_08220 [Halomonas sp.]|nr:hypothetical protein [Halomonas sp.]